MKKMWVVVLVLLLGFSFAMAQEIHWANQITIAWDAVTLLSDGFPIPAEDIIAYNVYLRNEDGTGEVLVTTVTPTEYMYTLPEGVHEAGVSALRYIGGTGEPFESEITWSGTADPPFLLGYGRPPAAPVGLRVQ